MIIKNKNTFTYKIIYIYYSLQQIILKIKFKLKFFQVSITH